MRAHGCCTACPFGSLSTYSVRMRDDKYDLKSFVLSEIPGLYVSPRPFPYSNARVSLQKSASSLMPLHAVAVAHQDWAAYRGPVEADDRVFRSSSFVGGLTPGDFPSLPNAVMGSFPSMGIHPLRPFILKHFGYPCADTRHPGRALLQHNCDREWAWSISKAFMCEVSINRRVLVQPPRLLAYLERTIERLPNLRLHPFERNSSHVVWKFGSALVLMQRTSAAGAGAQRLWTDFTFGERTAFLPYDARSDAFVACESGPSRFPGAAALGGVGSAAREARRKRYRDLDAVSPTPVFVGANSFRAAASSNLSFAPKSIPSVPPIPPIEPLVQEATSAPRSAICKCPPVKSR